MIVINVLTIAITRWPFSGRPRVRAAIPRPELLLISLESISFLTEKIFVWAAVISPPMFLEVLLWSKFAYFTFRTKMF